MEKTFGRRRTETTGLKKEATGGRKYTTGIIKETTAGITYTTAGREAMTEGIKLTPWKDKKRPEGELQRQVDGLEEQQWQQRNQIKRCERHL